VATRRFLPSDPADFLRSIIPLALLAVAAALPATRLVAIVLLVGGFAVATGRTAPVRWAWAAAIPVAIGLVWQAWRGESFGTGGLECGDLASPFAVARATEAVLVLGALVVLAVLLGANASTLAFRMPARRWWTLALAGFVVFGPLAVLVGPWFATPFFGDVGYDVTNVAALAPALLFAASNGVMEEVAYRGALLHWSGRVIGMGPALVGQALIFGLAHSGPDVAGSPVVLMVLMGLAGLVAGAVAIRTRSLLIPIAIHVALDLPIYYGFACGT
jgi:membrane protease YdiL (CAAX protease family)